MKNTFYTNTIIYFAIVGLYIYTPILGALGQIGLGVYQIVIAVLISSDIKPANNLGYTGLKIYWYAVLTWFISFIIFLSSSIFKGYDMHILYIIPMILGFFFVIVNYLIYKYDTL